MFFLQSSTFFFLLYVHSTIQYTLHVGTRALLNVAIVRVGGLKVDIELLGGMLYENHFKELKRLKSD